MRLFVKVYDVDGRECGTYVMPLIDGEARSVGLLKEDIIARHKRGQNPSKYELSLSSSGASLCDQDSVTDVLESGDYVTLSES